MANSRELAEQAFSLLQDALQNSENRAAELDAELRKQAAPKNEVERQAQVLEHRLEAVLAESERHQREIAQLQEVIENERAKAQALKKKLDIAESGPDRIDKKEVNYWRSRAEAFDSEAREYRQRIAELRRALRQHQTSVDGSAPPGDEASDPVSESAAVAGPGAEWAAAAAPAPAPDTAAESAEAFPDESQLAELNARVVASDQRLAERDAQLAERDAGIAERDSKMAGLEQQLNEERECAINLREIANERGEQITTLSEKLDEALERFEEAKWRLKRASHFKRLVKKRHKLVETLISAMRGKQKSNVALKAGLDGLRKFKARSEKQQQDLLLRVDELTRELNESKERLAEQKDLAEAEEKLSRANERVSALESRLQAQASVIESQENELRAARSARKEREKKSQELSDLESMLQVRDTTITQLKGDLDEQLRQLGQLRGSQSETQRLKSLKQEDQKLIELLQIENDNLKNELMEQQVFLASCRHDPESAMAGELRKRDAQITDLEQALNDQKKLIAQLEDTAAGWQKKYEFISTDGPSAYQAITGEK